MPGTQPHFVAEEWTWTADLRLVRAPRKLGPSVYHPIILGIITSTWVYGNRFVWLVHIRTKSPIGLAPRVNFRGSPCPVECLPLPRVPTPCELVPCLDRRFKFTRQNSQSSFLSTSHRYSAFFTICHANKWRCQRIWNRLDGVPFIHAQDLSIAPSWYRDMSGHRQDWREMMPSGSSCALPVSWRLFNELHLVAPTSRTT